MNTTFGIDSAAPGLGLDNAYNDLPSGEYLVRGFNLQADGGVTDGIWHPSTAFNFPPMAGIAVEEVSNNAQDSAAGTGARTIQVVGLDTNFAYQTATVVTAGVVPVALPGLWTWIQWMQTLTFGAFGANIGQPRIQAAGGGVTYEQMLRGDNRSGSCKFMMPANRTGFVTGWLGSVNLETLDPLTVAMERRFLLKSSVTQFGTLLPEGAFNLWDLQVAGQDMNFSREFSSPKRSLPPSGRIFADIQNVSGGNCRVSCDINLELDGPSIFPGP